MLRKIGTRGCLVGLVILSLVVLVAAFLLYRAISERANIRPLLSASGATDLTLPPANYSTCTPIRKAPARSCTTVASCS